MAGEAGRKVGGPVPRAARIAVIAALSVERAGLDKAPGTCDLLFRQSGPGAERARSAARAAVAAGAEALVAWGLAGGLTVELAPGDVVLPASGSTPDGRGWRAEPSWHAALAAALGERFLVHTGALVSVARIVESPAAKGALARSFGAVAVDMESAAIAAVAVEARVPFVAIRAVIDASEDALPSDAAAWIDADGGRRIRPLFGVVVTPARWPAMFKLAGRQRAARRTLDGIASCLLACRFCLTDGAPSAYP